MAANFRDDYKFVPEYSYGDRNSGGLLALLQEAIQHHQAQQPDDFSSASNRYDDPPSNWFTQLASLQGDQTPYQPRDVGQTRLAPMRGSQLTDDPAGSRPSAKVAPTRIAQIAIPLPPPIPIQVPQLPPPKIPMPTIPDHWRALGVIAQMLPKMVLGDSVGNGDEQTDPNFRQLTRRPSSQATIGASDQSAGQTFPISPVAAEPSMAPTNAMASSKSEGDEEDKEFDVDEFLRRYDAGVKARARQRGKFTPSDPGDYCTNRQKDEDKACYERSHEYTHWDFLQACIDQAAKRLAHCRKMVVYPDPTNRPSGDRILRRFIATFTGDAEAWAKL